MNQPYTLYIVSTPIGNLDDMTFRAIKTLQQCSLILAEDTRHSRVLMDHFDIRTPVESYHDFNKEKVTPKYIQWLQEQGDIALISDAGTPGLADPGFNLVRACIQVQIPVRPVPGASALLSALVTSGMPTDRFRFENFAPKKSGQRIHLLERLREQADQTIVFYATPHNILKFVHEIEQVFGSIYLVVQRELTKKFEEHLSGTPQQILDHFKERSPKGEFVVVFHPQNKSGLHCEDLFL